MTEDSGLKFSCDLHIFFILFALFVVSLYLSLFIKAKKKVFFISDSFPYLFENACFEVLKFGAI